MFQVDPHTEEDEIKKWKALVGQLTCVRRVDTNPHQVQMPGKRAHEKAGRVGHDATAAWADQRGTHVPSVV